MFNDLSANDDDNDELGEMLDKMPKMSFDSLLLTVHTNDDVNVDEKYIEIPICFGVPMITLREKHERELSLGSSFIEAKPPSKKTVNTLTDKILLNCETIEDIRAALHGAKAVLIFYVILEILQRLPSPLLPLTFKTAHNCSKIFFLKPAHPYDFMISEHLYSEIRRYYDEIGAEDTTSKYRRAKKPKDEIVHPLIQTYYLQEEPTKLELIRLSNKFIKCIFHDIHLIGNINQRNLIRFIIRNCIHFVRRYNISCVSRLRKQRGESWTMTNISTAPHVNEYSVRRIADLVGPLLMKQPGVPESFVDVEKHVMANLLHIDVDRLWLPKQKVHDILESDIPHCHTDCICGLGI
ncbi:unnamed protein product [Trichobilharzia szidati]|nr:unnamed protein product [Trichobilharzia szidati]